MSKALLHAYTRLLKRLEPSPEALWEESERWVVRNRGVLVIDDTVLDKPYAKKMNLV